MGRYFEQVPGTSKANRMRAALIMVWVLALAAGFSGPAGAQATGVGGAVPVRFMEYQVGRLDDATPQVAFSIDLVEGMVFSVSAFMRTGDVVPQVTVRDPGGQTFSLGVLPAGATDSSIVNAALAPVTGTYTVLLERASGTGGDFVLIVQPGYEYLYAWDDFLNYDPRLSLCWEPMAQLDSIWTINDGEMVAHVMSPSVASSNPPCTEFVLGDYYVEADVRIANTPDYYEYGLEVFRSPNKMDFYAVLFSSKGDWSVQHYHNGDWTPVSDWQQAPIIETAAEPVTVGVWVRGGTLTVYYNHQLVGQVVNPFGQAVDAGPALVVTSGQGALPAVEAHFDNLVITGPRPPNS